MRHASLFSGIGACDLAAELMGWQNIFQVEIDEFATRVLEMNFPHVHRFKDIKQFDPEPWKGKVDILTGGFPCQPFSSLGDKKGAEDHRFLWGEMLRVATSIRPEWIVAENVERLVQCPEFEQVCEDLENADYQVWPTIISARSVGAPHKRNRVFIVGHSLRRGCSGLVPEERVVQLHADRPAVPRALPVWESTAPAVGSLCGVVDGVSARLDLASYRSQKQRIHALGNAIVPPVMLPIFHAIQRSQVEYNVPP